MPQFEVRTSVADGRAVVALVGECDLAGRETLTAALRGAVERTDTVLVDLADLEFMDSSGVHGLVTAHHTARGLGGHLWIL